MEDKRYWAVLVAIWCVFMGVWIISSMFEADAYNRLTGGNATTLDAMFTELRVVGSEEKEKP